MSAFVDAVGVNRNENGTAHIVTCVIGNRTPLNLMIDSGADVNVLTLEDWETMKSCNAEVHDVNTKAETNIRSYASESNLVTECVFKAWMKTVASGKPETFAEFVVIGGGSKSLLGRQSAVEMKLLSLGLEVNRITSQGEPYVRFPSIPGVEVHFDVGGSPFRR